MEVEPCEENANIRVRVDEALESAYKILRFYSSETMVEKISFVGKLLHSYNILPKFIQDGKNDEKAREVLIRGNALFCAAEDEKALEMYNCTIALAEDKSETLAKAYANRSAIFYRANMYEECIQDIQRALENNYPKCLEKSLEDRRSKAENLKDEQRKIEHHRPIPTIPPDRRNEFIECASDSVEIRRLENMGRCVFATKNIRAGEVIAVEKPAFSILNDRKWCHCHHCLRLCYNLIPCTKCTQALFCSDNCKESAKIYHEFECAISATIHTLNLGSCIFMSLRMALIMSKHCLCSEPEENPRIYRSERCKEIHDLVTHADQRPVANLFKRTFIVTLLHYLLKQYTQFFNRKDKKYEKAFKESVMKNLMIAECNFHEIGELEEIDHTRKFKKERIGTSGFSFLSILNHSCIPNVYRVSYGETMILIAIQSIKKGEQLFDNYGFHYSLDTKKERQENLKEKFFMKCTCEACTNDYCMYPEYPSYDVVRILYDKYHDEILEADSVTAEKIKGKFEKVFESLERDFPCANHCTFQIIRIRFYELFGNIRRKLVTKK